MAHPAVQEILDFWFGTPDSEVYGQSRMEWFKKDDGFDAQVKAHLLDHHEQAIEGHYDDWKNDPWSALALIVLLDQVPRNLFRGSPRSFASDAKALIIARHVVDRADDQDLLSVMRGFIYLPFEHSEEMEDQIISVALFDKLGRPESLDYAWRHHKIIDRFGRFPHRNEVMGRASTEEEIEFLTQPNSSF